MKLQTHIDNIGNTLVGCMKNCAGIKCSQGEGILPRFLILETEGRKAGHGSVVVGINPAMSEERERRFYRERGATYEQTVKYWTGFMKEGHPYYRRLRELISDIGLAGPILWTELVKCENDTTEKPPLQTFRICANTYLRHELREIPIEWPLIAVGKEAYGALAYMFSERIVMGVPHSTGSFGRQFHRLRDENSLSVIKIFIQEGENEVSKRAEWLPNLLKS